MFSSSTSMMLFNSVSSKTYMHPGIPLTIPKNEFFSLVEISEASKSGGVKAMIVMPDQWLVSQSCSKSTRSFKIKDTDLIETYLLITMIILSHLVFPTSKTFSKRQITSSSPGFNTEYRMTGRWGRKTELSQPMQAQYKRKRIENTTRTQQDYSHQGFAKFVLQQAHKHEKQH